MDFYLDERQRKKRRRKLKIKIYIGLILFFVLIVGAAYLIVYSPLFKIKNIDITQIGTDGKRIDTDSVIQELKDFFTSQSKFTKFLGPDNILIWNNEKIGEILKNYPQITELIIEKDYLEWEIKVIVKEREKFGIWCLITRINADEAADAATRINADNISENQRNNQRESASCWWFDKTGIIFEEAPSVEGNLINKVDDFSGRTLKLGEIVIKGNLFSNLVKIFEVLEKSDLKIKSLRLERLELQEIITDSPGNLLPKIYFSLRIDPGFSLPALESFKNLGLEKIEYIDLRVENRAYYKLK